MTPDQMLRVLAFMEATWNQDAAAMGALTSGGPQETAIAPLIAQYGETVLQTLLMRSFGVSDSMDPAELQALREQMDRDPGVKMCVVLAEALKGWAEVDDPQAAGRIALTVISAILAFSAEATEDDVLPMIAALRAGVIRQN